MNSPLVKYRRKTWAFTRGAGAFTLIEALVAIAIIAAVLPILMSGISIATRAATLAKQRNLATSLAESKLNEIIATNDWQTGGLSGDFGDDAPGYTWSANVTQYSDPDLTTQDLQQIDLTVSWKSRSTTREVVLSTLVFVPDTSGATQ